MKTRKKTKTELYSVEENLIDETIVKIQSEILCLGTAILDRERREEEQSEFKLIPIDYNRHGKK